MVDTLLYCSICTSVTLITQLNQAFKQFVIPAALKAI